MPDLNGLEFVRNLNNPPLVVFITAYAEYAVDSYKVQAVDYLLKPYGFEDLQRAASNVMKRWEHLSAQPAVQPCAESGVLYLKVDYRYVRVELDDIIYIEGMNEYLKIKTVSGDRALSHPHDRRHTYIDKRQQQGYVHAVSAKTRTQEIDMKKEEEPNDSSSFCVRMIGLEPTCREALAPETSVSTISPHPRSKVLQRYEIFLKSKVFIK